MLEDQENQHDMADRIMRVALAGLGNSGQDVARRLTRGGLPEATLTAVTAREMDKACATLTAVSLFKPSGTTWLGQKIGMSK